MQMNDISAIFFDLGGTLGEPVFSEPPVQLVRFDLFFGVKANLQLLREKGYRLGIISNTGNMPGSAIEAVLGPTGILDLFEPELRIYSFDVRLTKETPQIFQLAAARAGLAENIDRCVYVGDNDAERAVAVAAGMQAFRDATSLSL
jgi:FMN phosphatase YigB (HAD superfamily)